MTTTAMTTCPTCKCEMQDGQINWVKVRWDEQRRRTELAPCPTCSADMQQRKRAQEKAERIARLFERANISWRAHDWEFASYPADGDRQALVATAGFVRRHTLHQDEKSKRLLILEGPTGSGKTGLAISALKVALRAEQSGLFLMTAEMFLRFQASFHQAGAGAPNDLLQIIEDVEWLVLDDLGVESGRSGEASAYVLKTLYFIIQKRADLGRFTIITTNLGMTDLERLWSPSHDAASGGFHEGRRITARLREYGEIVLVRGKNLRAR